MNTTGQQLPSLPEDLFPGGFSSTYSETDRPKREDIEVCKLWIQEYAQPAASIARLGSSYSYKHLVEREARTRVSDHRSIPNGAFIAAAIELGYRWRRVSPTSPNACFAMKLKKT